MVRHSIAAVGTRFKKQLVITGVVAAFAVVGVGLIAASRAATYNVVSEAESGTVSRADLVVTEPGASNGKAVKFGLGAGASTCTKNGSCTAAEVAVHNKQSDCWVIYDSRVFDITEWVPIHDGGPDVYDDTTCGHDITEYLAGDATGPGASHGHEHSQEAYDTLDTYFLADLK